MLIIQVVQVIIQINDLFLILLKYWIIYYINLILNLNINLNVFY